VTVPETVQRAGGLTLVLILFCAPLFIGLDRWDLRSDEAIYAYAIDRIVETGEWLTPRSIEVDGPFLEKPPLKFWLVAGLMRLGVIPRNEIGLRLLDALFAAAGFVYVYAFGLRLAGVLCGFAATLSLFTLDALLYEHGLRSNNMEAALFLCYCGGIYHLMRWIENDRPASLNPWATCGYFVLGFLTKFVAALFLPLIALIAVGGIPEGRARLSAGWRTWLVPVAVTLVASSAWFVYETFHYGRYFWDTILGLHVFTRFTSSLDPMHLHPWYYYFDATWTELARSGSRVIAAAGIVALMHGAWRGRPWQMRLLLAWWIVPYVLMSIGTSKLFHYAYPFLPPIALAIGFVAARVDQAAAAVAAVLARFLRSDEAGRSRFDRPLQLAGLAVALAMFVLAVATILKGQIAWRIRGVRVFQNSSVVRPFLLGTIALAVTGQLVLSTRMLAALILVFALPVWSYPVRAARVETWDDPWHVIGQCAQDVRDRTHATAGIYNTARGRTHHTHYYYLYRLGAWIEPEHPTDEELKRRLFTEGAQTPIFMTLDDYALLQRRALNEGWPELPRGTAVQGIVLILPGPYQTCLDAASSVGAQPTPSEAAPQASEKER
jgi:4-amino-4-deoxy-L-arabinose transferase-like glycosyltransferase